MLNYSRALAPVTNTGRQLEQWVDSLWGSPLKPEGWMHEAVQLSLMALLGMLLWWMLRLLTIKVIYPFIRRSRSQWDDALIKERFFRKFGMLAPLMLLYQLLPVVLHRHSELAHLLNSMVIILLIYALYRSFAAVMNASQRALKDTDQYRDKPLRSYTQLAKIVVGTIALVIVVAIVFQKNPIYIFSAMGAASAVLLLVFKDTLLGFIASVQLSVNDMVRVGDWVQLDKFGADGEVTDITLTTVKVRNWDMTYTTVPTYAFISDSVRNWRGMQESEGRRIKRAMNLAVGSIRFCTPADLERYAQYQLVAEHVRTTQREVAAYNQGLGLEGTLPINGRNQTNVGVFRAYAEAYLRQEPRIHKGMTLMARQLPASPMGLPLEIYCFSKDKSWVAHERLAADLFDHLLAAAPWFDLEVFQSPTGSDMRMLAGAASDRSRQGEA